MMEIGKPHEAESTLLSPIPSSDLQELAIYYGDQAAYVLLLLGHIRRRLGLIESAMNCYKLCLKHNPLIWTAFQSLCDIGESPEPRDYFNMSENLYLSTSLTQVLPVGMNRVHCKSGSISTNYSALPVGMDENFDLDSIPTENVNPFENITDLGNKRLANSTKLDHVNTQPFTPHALNATGNRDQAALSITGQQPPSHQPMEIAYHTPPSSPPPPVGPLAPKPRLGGEKITKFGWSSDAQANPFFACLPVLTFNSSSRHHRSSQSDTAMHQTGDLSSSSSSIIATAPSRRQQHDTAAASADKAVIRQLTSPPRPTVANNTSLRHLVLANTCDPSSSVGSVSEQHVDPPVLRSSGQRTAVVTSSSSLFTVPKLTHQSSSTPRASVLRPTSTSGGLQRPILQADTGADDQPTSPRTRAQVAAAAAASRSSSTRQRIPTTASSTNNRLRPRTSIAGTNTTTHTTPAPRQSVDPPNSDNQPQVNQPASFGGGSSCQACGGGLSTTATGLVCKPLVGKDDPDPRLSALANYLGLLAHLGKAYRLFVKHQWRSANKVIASLPSHQMSTAYVLAWAGCGHMDAGDYQTAQLIFRESRRLEPWQLHGAEYYSTVLWQLQASHPLSHLAHDLFELDHIAVEPWLVAGNCFSLQGEHELAVRHFCKALQVCPKSAYASTLLGHEQATLEEYELALAAFRYALKIDPLQYQALFGISNVYYKQEKFETAERYLCRALSVFPQSHLLLTHLGALRSRLGRIDDGVGSGLDLISRACKIQPDNPLACYHKASMLFYLGRYSEVLDELKQLLILAPREAMVYLMIGHTYKKLGNTPQAMVHYSWAMELDPKGANTHLRDIISNTPGLNNISSSSGNGNRRNGGRGPTAAATSAVADFLSSLPPTPDDSAGGGRRIRRPSAGALLMTSGDDSADQTDLLLSTSLTTSNHSDDQHQETMELNLIDDEDDQAIDEDDVDDGQEGLSTDNL